MKGQQEVLTSILITAILIGIIGSVLFWGLPLVQKSRDASTLENAEIFMKTLSDKIRFVANNGGKDRIVINVPGTVEFIPDYSVSPGTYRSAIRLTAETQGTIYAANAEVPLKRNECSRVDGVWSIHDPEILCVKSESLTDKKYRNTFRLNHVVLKTEGITAYNLSMIGPRSTGGEGRTITIENAGTTHDGNLINTLVAISIL
jgi:hypothetical protein